ncbi:hypothetical protein V1264_010174 [Littorina saxatilis]
MNSVRLHAGHFLENHTQSPSVTRFIERFDHLDGTRRVHPEGFPRSLISNHSGRDLFESVRRELYFRAAMTDACTDRYPMHFGSGRGLVENSPYLKHHFHLENSWESASFPGANNYSTADTLQSWRSAHDLRPEVMGTLSDSAVTKHVIAYAVEHPAQAPLDKPHRVPNGQRHYQDSTHGFDSEAVQLARQKDSCRKSGENFSEKGSGGHPAARIVSSSQKIIFSTFPVEPSAQTTNRDGKKYLLPAEPSHSSEKTATVSDAEELSAAPETTRRDVPRQLKLGQKRRYNLQKQLASSRVRGVHATAAKSMLRGKDHRVKLKPNNRTVKGGKGQSNEDGAKTTDSEEENSGDSRSKSYKCSQCRYKTDRKNNLKRHVVTMHQKSTRVLECCGTLFNSKASLRDHVTLFHRGGYRCQLCARNFCRKALLRRHLTVHSGQKDFSCDLCGYATSHKSNLERHQRVHARKSSLSSGLGERLLSRRTEGRHNDQRAEVRSGRKGKRLHNGEHVLSEKTAEPRAKRHPWTSSVLEKRLDSGHSEHDSMLSSSAEKRRSGKLLLNRENGELKSILKDDRSPDTSPRSWDASGLFPRHSELESQSHTQTAENTERLMFQYRDNLLSQDLHVWGTKEPLDYVPLVGEVSMRTENIHSCCNPLPAVWMDTDSTSSEASRSACCSIPKNEACPIVSSLLCPKTEHGTLVDSTTERLSRSPSCYAKETAVHPNRGLFSRKLCFPNRLQETYASKDTISTNGSSVASEATHNGEKCVSTTTSTEMSNISREESFDKAIENTKENQNPSQREESLLEAARELMPLKEDVPKGKQNCNIAGSTLLESNHDRILQSKFRMCCRPYRCFGCGASFAHQEELQDHVCQADVCGILDFPFTSTVRKGCIKLLGN